MKSDQQIAAKLGRWKGITKLRAEIIELKPPKQSKRSIQEKVGSLKNKQH